MNRFVQKLIAGAAAVAIAVTGLVGAAPTAKAPGVTETTQGTIKITNAENDNVEHTLSGWKLASLKNVDKDANNNLTFLIDTNNDLVTVIENSMTPAQKTAYMADANYYTEGGTENNPIGYLVANDFKGLKEGNYPWGGDSKGSDSSDLRIFATNLSKELAKKGAPTASPTQFKSAKNGHDNTCEQGLWFLKDTSTGPTTQSIPIIVATKLDGYDQTSTWGQVVLKMNMPTVDKKIIESASGTVTSGTNADARIGGVVKYELSSVIPTYTGYEMTTPPRVFKLIDTASKGLSVDESSVKSVKLTKGTTTVTLTDKDYDVSSDSYALDEGQEGYDAEYAGGKVTTIDLSNYVNKAAGSTSSTSGILEGATVTVEFEATVNNGAVIASVGNPNSVELEYSRTPNNESTKIPGPTVRVYTYDFGILKTDMAGNPIKSSGDLKGAQFVIARVDTTTKAKTFLSRNAETGAWSELNADTPAKDGTEAIGVFTTDADGKIKMSGLPEGTYYVEEIKAPTGYTNIGLPNFEFTISADFDTDGITVKKLEYKKTPGTDDRIAFDTTTASQANVKNAKNLTELPMTGDLGIKVFITVGVLLMAAGAAFALSARMRS